MLMCTNNVLQQTSTRVILSRSPRSTLFAPVRGQDICFQNTRTQYHQKQIDSQFNQLINKEGTVWHQKDEIQN